MELLIEGSDIEQVGRKLKKVNTKMNNRGFSIEQIKKKRVAIYCAGTHGLLFSKICKMYGIRIDAFFDSDNDKWGSEIDRGVICTSPYEIIDKDGYIVLICIRPDYYEEVKEYVRNIGFKNIVNFNLIIDAIISSDTQLYLDLISLCQTMPVASLFYTPEINNIILNKGTPDHYRVDKIAVYTGVFGNYDDIFSPKVFPDNIDYYFFSDHKPEKISGFKWIDAKEVIPGNVISSIKRNRYIKMHPHILFPEYKYSIYVDGNVSIEDDITPFIKESKTGISAFLHPIRDCIYYEALAMVNARRVIADDVRVQMQQYLREGMPIHYGLLEMMIIAREHHKKECIMIMEKWWEEFNAGAQRDQLSFMYVMWKNGKTISDISLLGRDSRKNSRVKVNSHFYKSWLIRNDKAGISCS